MGTEHQVATNHKVKIPSRRLRRTGEREPHGFWAQKSRSLPCERLLAIYFGGGGV